MRRIASSLCVQPAPCPDLGVRCKLRGTSDSVHSRSAVTATARRLLMARKACVVLVLAAVFALAIGSTRPDAQNAAPKRTPPSGPIKLARHPDYHAGKVTFSYMGDIWT